jgi:hypothetical protein
MKIEVWNSNHNRQERHYFIEGGDQGYQHNTYVFGYNPALVDEATANKIIALIMRQDSWPA